MAEFRKTLIYGYGNPGRQDDGLGAAFVKLMETHLLKHALPKLSLDCNYQLNVEDAELIAGYDTVIFVDASQEEIDHFKLTSVDPSESRIEFTMHAVSVAYVLDLCKKMFGKSPATFLLHIRGYEWDFKEELTKNAIHNLELAFNFVIKNIHHLHELDKVFKSQVKSLKN